MSTDDDVVFLLGAGSSYDAGIPLARQLTDLIRTKLRADLSRDGQRLSRVLDHVVETIQTRSHDPLVAAGGSPDIETVVSTVEMLQDRAAFELNPFVETWDPTLAAVAVDADDRAELAKIESDGAAEFSRTGDATLRDHARALRKLIEGGELESDRMNELLNRLHQTLIEVLAIKPTTPLDYFTPLLQLARTGRGVTVATLNYDLTIETAAATARVPCSCGVDAWESVGTVKLPDNGIRLLKLHGSLDWVRGTTVPFRGAPGIAMTRLELRAPNKGDTPFLVFGRREKLRAQGPFLALRADFSRRLAAARCLVVIGYSFADDHVNELVGRWVNGDAGRTIVVVDPSFPQRLGEATGFTRSMYGGLSKPPLLGPNTPGARLWVLRQGTASALPIVSFADPARLLTSVEAAT